MPSSPPKPLAPNPLNILATCEPLFAVKCKWLSDSYLCNIGWEIFPPNIVLFADLQHVTFHATLISFGSVEGDSEHIHVEFAAALDTEAVVVARREVVIVVLLGT